LREVNHWDVFHHHEYEKNQGKKRRIVIFRKFCKLRSQTGESRKMNLRSKKSEKV
jgi:hypothetical protein